MATVKELEGRLLELKQVVMGLQMTLDSKLGEVNADLLTLKQQVRVYFEKDEKVPTPATPPTVVGDPWRLPLDQFKNWAVSIEQNWEPNGNARIGQRLAKALRRPSGHAEGQLYINWKGKEGYAACKAYWKTRGFDDIPEGL